MSDSSVSLLRRRRQHGSSTTQLVISLIVIGIIIAYAVFLPIVMYRDQVAVDFANAYAAPNASHVFGCDSEGHDLFVRTAQALRVSLIIAGTTAVFSAIVGTIIGVTAALTGGIVDQIVMRIVDGLNALPHLIMGLVIVSLFKGSIVAMIASLVLTHWIPICRITRAQVMNLRQADFIQAAYLGGRGKAWVIWRHMIPASLGQALVGLVLLIPHAIWHESTLSFLGVGLPPHKASLGTLLADAQGGMLLGAWWILVFPSLFLVAFSLAVSSGGQAIVDRIQTSSAGAIN